MKRAISTRAAGSSTGAPIARTALSDAEVEYAEQARQAAGISAIPSRTAGEYLVVATTRPETMMGDTGVAVNPE